MWLLLSVVLMSGSVFGQYVQSPCPDIFNYISDGGNIYGLMRLNPFGRAETILVRMSFTIDARLHTNYIGSIVPLGSETQLLEDFNRGVPISYRVNFPVTSPLPKLTSLVVNDKVLCYGQGDIAGPTHFVTTVRLEHMLYYKSGGGVVYRPNTQHQIPHAETSRPDIIYQIYPENPDTYFTQVPNTSRPQLPPQTQWDRNPPSRWEPPPRQDPPAEERPSWEAAPSRWDDTPAWEQTPRPESKPPRKPPTRKPQTPPPPREPEPTQEFIEETPPPTKRPKPQRTTQRPDPVETGVETKGACGVNGVDSVPLIYRGTSYERGKWPWLVALFKRKYTGLSYICAGTLISNKHVISAAHCMQRKNTYTASKDIVVRLGVYNLDDWTDDQVVIRNLETSAIHDSYNSTTLANDILLLTLDRTVEYSFYIKAACLWSGITDLNAIVESSGVVAGWGASEAGSAGRGEPRMVRMPIVSTTTCRASKLEFHKLTSSKTLCAGDRNGAGPCLGDSGGGLYILDSNTGRWRLRGIVSISLWSQSGEDTCNLDDYIVFTDTAQYLPWIKSMMAI